MDYEYEKWLNEVYSIFWANGYLTYLDGDMLSFFYQDDLTPLDVYEVIYYQQDGNK